jgi:hypothetical protein
LCIWVLDCFLIYNFISLILVKSTTASSSRTSDYHHLCHSPTQHRHQQASFVHKLVEIFRLCLFKKIRSKYLFILEKLVACSRIQRKFLFNKEIQSKYLFILESFRNYWLFQKFNLVNCWLFYKLKEVHRIFLFIIEIHKILVYSRNL